MNRSRRAFSRFLSVFLAAATLTLAAPGAIQTRTIPLKPNEALLRVLPRVQGGSYAILGGQGLVIVQTGRFLPFGQDSISSGFVMPFSRVDGATLGAGGLQIVRLDAMDREISRVAVGSSPGTVMVDAFVDTDGSLVLLGGTTDRNFPAVNPLFPFAIPHEGEGIAFDRWGFLLRTDADGSRIATSTLIGGTMQADAEIHEGTSVYGLARDSSGNIYVSGATSHRDFPVSANGYKRDARFDLPFKRSEGFLLKVDRNLRSLLYSTFLGSDEPLGLPQNPLCTPGLPCPVPPITNIAKSVRIGAGQQPWVMLLTTGKALPTTEGAFVAKPVLPVPDDAAPIGRRPIPYSVALLRLDSTGASLLTAANLGEMASLPFYGSSIELLSDGSPVTVISRDFAIDRDRIEIMKLSPSASAVSASYTIEAVPAGLSLAEFTAGPNDTLWLTGRDFANRAGANAFGGVTPTLNLGADFLLQLSGSDVQPRRLWLLPDLLNYPGIRATSYGVELSSLRGIVTSVPVFGDLGPAILSVRNVASGAVQTGISPYEFLRVDGIDLGLPAATPQFDRNGLLPTALEGVRVTVDGVPCPLLSVSEESVQLIAPETLTAKGEGGAVEMVLESEGQAIARYTLYAAKANPKIFPVKPVPLNPFASALNQDGTLNSQNNPAKEGETVAFFLNGLGSPAGASIPAGRRVENAMPWSALRPSVFSIAVASFSTPDRPAWEVEYFGVAPGLAAGTVQMNVKIPTQVRLGQLPPGQPARAELLFQFAEPPGAPAGGHQAVRAYADFVSIWIGR